MFLEAVAVVVAAEETSKNIPKKLGSAGSAATPSAALLSQRRALVPVWG